MAEHNHHADDIADDIAEPETEPARPPTQAALHKHLDALIEGVPLSPGDLSPIHLHALLGHLLHARRILKG